MRLDLLIIKYRPGFINIRLNALSRELKDIPRDIEDDRLKVKKKLLINKLYFDELFSIFEGGELSIDYIIIAGEPLVIYYLKGEEEEAIYTDDIINRAYANSLIITDIIIAIKIGN